MDQETTRGKTPCPASSGEGSREGEKPRERLEKKTTAELDDNMPTEDGKDVEKEIVRRLKLFDAANFEDDVEGAENEEDTLTNNFDAQSKPSLDIACT